MPEILAPAMPDIPLEQLLSALHVEADDEDAGAFDRMRREAVAAARPKAVYARLAVQRQDGCVMLGGARFDSAFVCEKLAEQTHVVVYVATCGREVDAWAKAQTGFFESFAAETLKQMVLAVMTERLFAAAAPLLDADKRIATLNPGSLSEWPLTGQQPLFAALGTAEAIGVTLTDSCLMVPNKSVSGIMFASAEDYHNCQHCPRAHCPNRRAAFAGMWQA